MSGKNVNGDVLLDGYSCSHSQPGIHIPTQQPILICSLTLKTCEKRCDDKFEYEPGTDAGERSNA